MRWLIETQPLLILIQLFKAIYWENFYMEEAKRKPNVTGKKATSVVLGHSDHIWFPVWVTVMTKYFIYIYIHTTLSEIITMYQYFDLLIIYNINSLWGQSSLCERYSYLKKAIAT